MILLMLLSTIISNYVVIGTVNIYIVMICLAYFKYGSFDLVGISIFLTQRLSMATMDPAQKPMMYAMNGFFILIFNQFPSGLNLYYTVYNLLNYFQQKSIRA